MHIGFFGTKPWEEEYIRRKMEEGSIKATLFFTEKTINAEEVSQKSDFTIISLFVDSALDEEALNLLPTLKHVCTRSTGYDHIDLVACEKRDISVSSVPSYGENTVAEFTFALILALSRKIFDAYHQVREDGSFKVEGLQGFDLMGRTLGVVGSGRIGKHVIKIARGFGMNVLAYDKNHDRALSEALGFTYASFEELLGRSDIVTLHLPYMESTEHLFDDEAFKKMKKGAHLINTSRGGVVDTEALIRALRTGQIGGAGLDVLEEEGIIKDELAFLTEGHQSGHNLKIVLANHVLIDMPNVIVTPHNAFNTKEALQRILDTTVENIKHFIDGNPINIVHHGEN